MFSSHSPSKAKVLKQDTKTEALKSEANKPQSPHANNVLAKCELSFLAFLVRSSVLSKVTWEPRELDSELDSEPACPILTVHRGNCLEKY